MSSQSQSNAQSDTQNDAFVYSFEKAAESLARVLLKSVDLYDQEALSQELIRSRQAYQQGENDHTQPHDYSFVIETHKIDYRAAFSAYICQETFDVYDKFEQKTSSGKNYLKAEPVINQIYRELSNNPENTHRATEYMVQKEASALITLKIPAVDQNGRLQSSQSGLMLCTNYALVKHEWQQPSSNIQWVIEDNYLPRVVPEHNLRIKILLTHPISGEILGTFNLYLRVTRSLPGELNAKYDKIREVLDNSQPAIAQLCAAYAQIREHRRLAIQNTSRNQISHLFDWQNAPHTTQNLDKNKSARDLHFPKIEQAVSRALTFLGQYCQARHLLLIEVYQDDNGYDASIFRTWSTTFKSLFSASLYSELIDQCSIPSDDFIPTVDTVINTQHYSLHTEHDYLQAETEQLKQVAEHFSIDQSSTNQSSIYQSRSEFSESDLIQAIEGFLRDKVDQSDALQNKRSALRDAYQKRISFAVENNQNSENSSCHGGLSVLPAKLNLRALREFVCPSEVLDNQDTSKVTWYLAFVDRADDAVARGKLHRWSECQVSLFDLLDSTSKTVDSNPVTDRATATSSTASIVSSTSAASSSSALSSTSAMLSPCDKALANIIVEMKREFASYLRGYKDECIQYVWQNESALQPGTGFSADDTQWLKWLEKFVSQCIECDQIHYVLPDFYFAAFCHNTAPFSKQNSQHSSDQNPEQNPNHQSNQNSERNPQIKQCIDTPNNVHIQSLRFYTDTMEQNGTKLEARGDEKLEDEWSVSNHLILRRSQNSAELFITISRQNRDNSEQQRELSAYTSHWALVAVNQSQRYSYLHLKFIKAFLAEVARIRFRVVKSHLHHALKNIFASEDNINDKFEHSHDRVNTFSRHISRENQLASKMLALVREQILLPFLGIDAPMLLATKNTNSHPVHFVSNQQLDRQFAIEDDEKSDFLRASLRHILRIIEQLEKQKTSEKKTHHKSDTEYSLRDYDACEFTSAGTTLKRVLYPRSTREKTEQTRSLETGRYSLAFKLAFMPKEYFDGAILFVGRAKPFDKWMCYCLAETTKALIPALSVSFINQQSMTKLGLMQHALNSPAQGIISLAKLSIKKSLRMMNSFSCNYGIGEKTEKLVKELNHNRDEINLLGQEIRSWKVALQAVEEALAVDVSEQHNLAEDLWRWTQRYQSRAEELNLSLNINIPFSVVEITYSPIHMDIAFSNLLDNALKYSAPNTAIEITLTVNQPKVIINVINIGAYISDEFKRRILGFGQRGKNAVESATNGQGIGLPLVAKFVKAHPNGELKISSEKLKGKEKDLIKYMHESTQFIQAENTFSIIFSDHMTSTLFTKKPTKK